MRVWSEQLRRKDSNEIVIPNTTNDNFCQQLILFITAIKSGLEPLNDFIPPNEIYFSGATNCHANILGCNYEINSSNKCCIWSFCKTLSCKGRRPAKGKCICHLRSTSQFNIRGLQILDAAALRKAVTSERAWVETATTLLRGRQNRLYCRRD